MTGPRIALVTQSAPGALNRISLWLRHAFENLGAAFDVVFLEGPPQTREFGVTREMFLGVDYARRSIPALTRYMRQERPAVVVSSPEFLSPYVVVAARLARVVAVPWEAALYPQGLDGFPLRKRLLFRRFQRLTYPSASLIACVSEGVLEYVADMTKGRVPRDRFVVIPNPVDQQEIRARAGRSGREPCEGGFRFCASGRLNYGKGMDVLIQAARLLSHSHPTGWSIDILGRGDQEAHLHRLIADFDLGESVRLRGFVDDPYGVMAAADCFVHPARWEGFGLVLCEAMSLGVPVVATDCPGGPRDVLENGRSGLLVSPEDPGELAEGMSRMMSDASLRERLVGNATASLERYDPHRVANLFRELADRVATPA